MAKLPVFATVGRAFSDTLRAARAMPVLVFAGVVATGANALADRLPSLDDPTGKFAAAMMIGVVLTTLMAPVQIGFYRFVILDEVTRHYTLNLSSALFRRFCVWSIAYFLLTQSLVWIPFALGIEGDVKTFVEIALSSVGFAIGVSIALIFPALAVDAPGTTLGNALADLRGSYWRVFGILILVVLPVLTMTILAMFFAMVQMEIDKLEGVEAFAWPAFLLIELLLVTAAARIFPALADRLRSPVSL